MFKADIEAWSGLAAAFGAEPNLAHQIGTAIIWFAYSSTCLVFAFSMFLLVTNLKTSSRGKRI